MSLICVFLNLFLCVSCLTCELISALQVDISEEANRTCPDTREDNIYIYIYMVFLFFSLYEAAKLT